RVPLAADCRGGIAAIPSHRSREIPAPGDAGSYGRGGGARSGGNSKIPGRADQFRLARVRGRRSMTERVARLRQASLDARPWLSIERGKLLTEFYRMAGALSAPMMRARALEYILERCALYIGAEELIVGERGPAPKSAPTYPEICCHTVEDFEILDTREKISYCVSADARKVQAEEVIPFWQGKSMRDRMFE